MAMVPGVAEAVENGLAGLSWWAYVQRLASGQLGARGHKMQLHIPLVRVPNPQNVVLIPVQASKCRLLEIVHHLPLLFFRGVVGVRECNNSRRITPLAAGTVDQLNSPLWITSQDFGGRITAHKLASTDAELVIFGHDLVSAIHDGRTAAARAVCEETNYCHGLSKARSSRSITSKTESTCSRPAAGPFALHHLAIWLRLLPTRCTAAIS